MWGRRRAVLTMVLVTFLWATAGMVSRQLHHAKGFEVTFWRSAFTALVFTVALPYLKGMQVFGNIRKAGWHFWVSGVCWSVMFTAFMLALTMTSVGNVLVTMSMGPLLTAIFSRIFLGHQLPRRTIVAIALASAGIAYMYLSQLDHISLAGTLIALCVPIAGASNWTLTQHAYRHGESVDLLTSVWLGAMISAATTVAMAWPFQADGLDLAWLGFLGLFQLAVPCALSVRCSQVLAAPEMSLLQLMEIIFGIIMVWLVVGEAPSPATLVGGAVVLAALVGNEVLA